jgi:hypothetical protein
VVGVAGGEITTGSFPLTGIIGPCGCNLLIKFVGGITLVTGLTGALIGFLLSLDDIAIS